MFFMRTKITFGKFLPLFTLCIALCSFMHVAAAALPLVTIKLPPGFEITTFVDNVPGARSMALGDNGTLFVGTRAEGKVYAIKFNGSQVQQVYTIASGLQMPNGVAFRNGALYVAEVSRLLRFDNIEAHLQQQPEQRLKPVVVTDKYPTETHHGWKFIRFGPDGLLYIPIGAPCNICDRGDPYASITRLDVDKADPTFEIVARGIRNTVGFDWQPQTNELWFTENGRDMLGDDIPPEELNHVTKPGQHFGYPYCHAGTIKDPEFGSKAPGDQRDCKQFTPPALKFPAHSAGLGMRFYTGNQFPAEYRNQIFIAQHGSWNRSKKVGYKILHVTTKIGSLPVAETFAEGWLQADDKAWGRPVDVQQMADGALLVSDDLAGVIYRIAYTKNK
jgi:glucose/arabinose dehydrogenase